MPTSRVRLGAIALVALALAPSGAAAQTGEAYMRAMELEQAEKYREAAGAYREALRANPGSVPVVLGLERVYAQIGLTDSIVPVLEAQIAAHPRVPAFRTALLRSFRSLGDQARARAAFEKWRLDWPRETLPYREYAKLLLDDQQTEAADSVLRRAQADLGTGRGLEFELAQLRAATGLWEQSAGSWRSAVSANGYLDQAAIFSLMPTPAATRPAVRRALLAPPLEPAARRILAALELAWGSPREGWFALRDLPGDSAAVASWLDFARRAEEAQAWLPARDALVAAMRRGFTPDLAVRAASAALSGGDAEAAIALSTESERRLEPVQFATMVLPIQMRALSVLGKPNEARALLDRFAVHLDPDQHGRLTQLLAWAWVRAGDMAQARALIGQSEGARTSEAAGWLALYEGDLRAARRVLKPTTDASPELVAALALLARTKQDSAPAAGRAFLLLARGDSAVAAQAFEDAARGVRDAAPLLLASAARLHAARRDRTRAVALWRQIVESHADSPEAPEAELEWARALRRAGELAAAIGKLEHLILTYPQSALVPQARRELELARAGVPAS
jgi:tetratricopeptide (TPR) repeat protein